VLANLARQRLKRRDQQVRHARQLRLLVLAAAERDATTHGAWGRSERIARRLHGLVTARHVRRILKDSRTSAAGVSDSSWSNDVSQTRGPTDDGPDRNG
jgi:hypothetical protein